MQPTLTRRRLAVLTIAVALLAAGCGVTGSTESAGVAGSGRAATGSTTTVQLNERSFTGTGGAVFLTKAAEATSKVDSVTMAMTMTMAGLPAVGEATVHYEGAFDNQSGRGSLSMDLGDLLGSLGSLGSSGSGQEMGTIEMVLDGDTVYLKSPLFSMIGGDGKPWLKADAKDLSGDGSSFGGSMQTDPGAFLDFLKGVGGTLETVGREDVRGEATTHLRTEIDLVKLLKDSSAAERADLEKQLEGLGGAGDTVRKIPAEVWVDDNGYVRKFQMVFDFSGAAGSSTELGDTKMTIEVEMYGFNEPVTVTIPDPSQVGDLDPSVLGGN